MSDDLDMKEELWRTVTWGGEHDAWETPCPSPKSDGWHCTHWYDGDGCHFCNEPALSDDELEAQGSERREPAQSDVTFICGHAGVISRPSSKALALVLEYARRVRCWACFVADPQHQKR